MTSELVFRAVFSTLWILFFAGPGWARYSARRRMGERPADQIIPRQRLVPILAIASFAPFWFAGIVFYAILPGWISFLSIPLPDWFRWMMALAGALSIPFMYWGFRTLGKNWVHAMEPSKFQQKKNEILVTTGPYSYVRNPIYLGAFSLILAQALVAANWLVFLPALPIIAIIYMQVPGEEAMLAERFGGDYREYKNRTPRIIPRLRRKHQAQQEQQPSPS